SVALRKVGAAPRTLVVMSFALGLYSLGVEFFSHLVDDLEILLGEILVLVAARFFVDWHSLPRVPLAGNISGASTDQRQLPAGR
ncbi:MAG: hypothetical protein ACJ78G_14360, partial [Gemmatimonadaceae bacterium]